MTTSPPADAGADPAPGPSPRLSPRAEELSAALRRRLAAPLVFDLVSVRPTIAADLERLNAAQGLAVKSFGDLFHLAQPPIELIEWTKEFAKRGRAQDRGGLPREVATLLYLTSIAAALARCDRRITGLDDAALSRAFSSMLALPWIEDVTRRVLLEGLNVVGDEDEEEYDAEPVLD